MRVILWTLAAALSLCAANTAMAEPTYEYVFDQPNYVVAPGGSALVQVYLRETLALGDTSLLATEGLLGGGVRVTFDNAPLPADRAEVAAPGDVIPNASFDGFAVVDHVPGSSAGFSAVVDFVSPPVGASGGPVTFDTFLSSFLFTAGTLPGEVTNLSAIDFDTFFDDIVTNDTFTVLDGLVSDGQATITVQGTAAVPEPASWLLWGSVALGLVLAQMRRRQCKYEQKND